MGEWLATALWKGDLGWMWPVSMTQFLVLHDVKNLSFWMIQPKVLASFLWGALSLPLVPGTSPVWEHLVLLTWPSSNPET